MNTRLTKSDVKILPFQHNITIGTRVVFIDGSYCTAIINKKFDANPYLVLSEDIWTVIAVNVSCPSVQTDIITGSLNYSNNCICVNEKGDIAFCSHINIRSFKISV